MKRTLYLLMVALGLNSCCDKKCMLSGNWKYNTVTSKDVGNSTVMVNSSGEIEFESNGSFRSTKSGTLVVLNKTIDVNNVVSSGTWFLSDDELYLTTEVKETNNKEKILEGFQNAGFSDTVIQLMDKFSDNLSKDGGDIMTDKIIQIDDKTLILEKQGDMLDGEKTTYHKIK